MSAIIRYSCPACAKKIVAPAQLAGHSTRCRSCGELFQIPELETIAPAPIQYGSPDLDEPMPRRISFWPVALAVVMAGGASFLGATFLLRADRPVADVKLPEPKPIPATALKPAPDPIKKEKPKTAKPVVDAVKPITFEKALVEAKKSLASIEVENVDKAADRLPFDQRIQLEGAVERIQKDGPLGISPELALAVFNNGMPKFAGKTYGTWAIDEDKFQFTAKIIWDKVNSFQNAASLERAAVVFGLHSRLSGLYAINYLPFNGQPASIFVDQKSIDYWEAFSGTTWDKLK